MKKILKFVIILMMILVLIIGISVFIKFKMEQDKSKSESINNDDYKIINDLDDALYSNNKYVKRYHKAVNANTKLFKYSGIYEGIYCVQDKSIYKINVNTNNFMMFSGQLKNCCQFQIIDSNEKLLSVGMFVHDKVEAYKEVTENNDKKKWIFEDNGWVCFKVKGGIGAYYNLDKAENSCVYVGLILEDYSEIINEYSYKELCHSIIECFNITYIGEKEKNTNYYNMLFCNNTSDIALTENIKINLTNNLIIKQIFNGGYENETMPIINTIRLNTKDEKYAFSLTEEDDISIEGLVNSVYGQSLNLKKFKYKELEFCMFVDDNNNFSDLFLREMDIYIK